MEMPSNQFIYGYIIWKQLPYRLENYVENEIQMYLWGKVDSPSLQVQSEISMIYIDTCLVSFCKFFLFVYRTVKIQVAQLTQDSI